MRALRVLFARPFPLVLALTAAVGISMLLATPYPMDDHFLYQKFIERLASGVLDLTIPGFHGQNFIAVPWFWVTRSPLTQIHVQMLSGVLLPLFAYFAAKGLFRSPRQGLIFAAIIALMPFLSFSSLRGWMVATYNLYLFLTLILLARRSRWAALPWGFSMTALPFAAALLPLFLAYLPQKGSFLRRTWHIAAACAVPALYILIQLLQAGRIMVGTHVDEFSAASIWAGPVRWFLNAAHGVQMLFSIHNYYFPDPAKTALGNMVHTTPVLVFLGLWALLSWRTYYDGRRLPIALALGFLIGIAMNVAIDHMDHFYMETGVLFIILAALPVLDRHPLWIPIVLGTLHFQWFYFYLQFREVFALGPSFFLTPLVADLLFVLACIVHGKEVIALLRSLVSARSRA